MAFSSISREQRESLSKKQLVGMPAVGWYNPRYDLVRQKPRYTDFSKASQVSFSKKGSQEPPSIASSKQGS